MHVQLEDRRLQRARINQLAYFVIIAFLVLLGRLWYLQIVKGKELLKASESNAIKLLRTRAPRGTVLDRKGRILARSRPQFVVLAMPDKLRDNKEALQMLCDILGMTPTEIDAIVDYQTKHEQARPGSPVRIKSDVSLETVARIGENRMYLPGVSVELDQLRNYPDGPAVAHIMGHLGKISERELRQARADNEEYQPWDYVGKSGLEKQYERELRGTDGGKEIMVDVTGRMVRVLGEKTSIPGKALKLSIDRDCQVAAYRAMGAQCGAVVALDPRTGAVLAMVSAPSYDPNVFVKKVSAADWNRINNDRRRPQQNRALSGIYPPGSTFKPLMAIAGLVYGQCNLKTTCSCPGYFRLGRTFRCWRVHGGGVNFNRAIAESCDVWFYHLAMKLGVDRMAKVARQFGIGQATGIDLPAESPYRDQHLGTMPDTAWKWRRFHEKWYPGETPSCGIGQGYVAVTPLQLATAISGIATNGHIHKPYLVDSIIDTNGRVVKHTKPELRRRVQATPEQFEMVRNAMRLAVTSGTAKACDMPDIAVCAKTGSAENPHGAAHGWFVCFAPMHNPTIAIACVVEHGKHGATSAGPVCRAILDVYFGKRKPEQIGSGKANVRGD